MSRELLKRALDELDIDRDTYGTLCKEIETYLAQPEPEPVASINGWYGGYPTVCSINGAVLPVGMALYPHAPARLPLQTPHTTQIDQSALVNELSQSDKNCLEAEIIDTQRELIKAQEYIKELAAEHTVLLLKHRGIEQQLAALQAREPLSIDEIAKMWVTSTSDVGNSTIHDYALFARAIETAHGIGINHE